MGVRHSPKARAGARASSPARGDEALAPTRAAEDERRTPNSTTCRLGLQIANRPLQNSFEISTAKSQINFEGGGSLSGVRGGRSRNWMSGIHPRRPRRGQGFVPRRGGRSSGPGAGLRRMQDTQFFDLEVSKDAPRHNLCLLTCEQPPFIINLTFRAGEMSN